MNHTAPPTPPTSHLWRRLALRAARGQSLAEFAMVFPILIILVFGVIDFAMGARSYVTLTHATRESARYGSVGNPLGSAVTSCVGQSNTTVVGRACTVSEGLDKSRMTVTPSCDPECDSGGSIIVEATYEYQFFTPLDDFLDVFTGGAFPESLDLKSSSDMRLE